MIDRVVGAPPPAAERHDHEPDSTRVHPRQHPGACRDHGPDDGRGRQMAVGVFEQTARPTQRRDHARETLRRRAGVQHPLDGRDRFRVISGEPAESQQLRA